MLKMEKKSELFTCIMNRIIGFEALYLLGFDPSRTPPCGAALSVAVGDADDETAVTVRVIIEVAMLSITWAYAQLSWGA
jgi:hypothetical protein